jgi:hypothetical protein
MKVKIVDRTQFEADKCNNGGSYSFTTTYRQINGDQFEVLHSTSSELPYCQLCGSFYQGSCPCGMEGPDIVSWEEVKKEIEVANIRRYHNGEEIRVYWED